MKIKIFGNSVSSQNLYSTTIKSLESLGLSDFVGVELVFDDNYKNKLDIINEPAFIVEEESIDFEDVIFQGEVPSFEEINSLIISLVGGSDNSCSSGSCSSCSSGCSF